MARGWRVASSVGLKALLRVSRALALEAESYVGIDADGDADVCVAEEFLDHDSFDALLQERELPGARAGGGGGQLRALYPPPRAGARVGQGQGATRSNSGQGTDQSPLRGPHTRSHLTTTPTAI